MVVLLVPACFAGFDGPTDCLNDGSSCKYSTSRRVVLERSEAEHSVAMLDTVFRVKAGATEDRRQKVRGRGDTGL